MKHRRVLASLATAISLAYGVAAAQEEALPQTLFTNVHVFDGVNE